ncbi:hypothetical protein HK102_003100, partial [Quaeritorhiza haematococci]
MGSELPLNTASFDTTDLTIEQLDALTCDPNSILWQQQQMLEERIRSTCPPAILAKIQQESWTATDRQDAVFLTWWACFLDIQSSQNALEKEQVAALKEEYDAKERALQTKCNALVSQKKRWKDSNKTLRAVCKSVTRPKRGLDRAQMDSEDQGCLESENAELKARIIEMEKEAASLHAKMVEKDLLHDQLNAENKSLTALTTHLKAEIAQLTSYSKSPVDVCLQTASVSSEYAEIPPTLPTATDNTNPLVIPPTRITSAPDRDELTPLALPTLPAAEVNKTGEVEADNASLAAQVGESGTKDGMLECHAMAKETVKWEKTSKSWVHMCVRLNKPRQGMGRADDGVQEDNASSSTQTKENFESERASLQGRILEMENKISDLNAKIARKDVSLAKMASHIEDYDALKEANVSKILHLTSRIESVTEAYTQTEYFSPEHIDSPPVIQGQNEPNEGNSVAVASDAKSDSGDLDPSVMILEKNMDESSILTDGHMATITPANHEATKAMEATENSNSDSNDGASQKKTETPKNSPPTKKSSSPIPTHTPSPRYPNTRQRVATRSTSSAPLVKTDAKSASVATRTAARTGSSTNLSGKRESNNDNNNNRSTKNPTPAENEVKDARALSSSTRKLPVKRTRTAILEIVAPELRSTAASNSNSNSRSMRNPRVSIKNEEGHRATSSLSGKASARSTTNISENVAVSTRSTCRGNNSTTAASIREKGKATFTSSAVSSTERSSTAASNSLTKASSIKGNVASTSSTKASIVKSNIIAQAEHIAPDVRKTRSTNSNRGTTTATNQAKALLHQTSSTAAAPTKKPTQSKGRSVEKTVKKEASPTASLSAPTDPSPQAMQIETESAAASLSESAGSSSVNAVSTTSKRKRTPAGQAAPPMAAPPASLESSLVDESVSQPLPTSRSKKPRLTAPIKEEEEHAVTSAAPQSPPSQSTTQVRFSSRLKVKAMEKDLAG